MSLNLRIPEGEKKTIEPKILVFGVGGAGSNAVDNMINTGLNGVDFVSINTDSQALNKSLARNKICIGGDLTRGLGAGSYAELGRAAAVISKESIEEYLKDCDMLFITAGMGGGTGTGASPVIAKIAKDMGVLVVSVIAKPFEFEGLQRMQNAERGIKRLRKYADTLIVIPNQNLFRIANINTTFENAFQQADAVLHAGVRSITDLITMPGLINLDFADIKAIMGKMGKAMMGTGEASGESRATMAAEAAICNPLLDNISIKGARGVLINITGGTDMTLFEVDEATRRISSEVDPQANIIFGSAFNKDMNGKIKISVVATGIDSDIAEEIDEEYEEDFNFNRDEVENLLKKESVQKTLRPPVSADNEEQTTNNKTGLLFKSIQQIREDVLRKDFAEINAVEDHSAKTAMVNSDINPAGNILEENNDNGEDVTETSTSTGDFFDFGNSFIPEENESHYKYADVQEGVAESSTKVSIALETHATDEATTKRQTNVDESGILEKSAGQQVGNSPMQHRGIAAKTATDATTDATEVAGVVKEDNYGRVIYNETDEHLNVRPKEKRRVVTEVRSREQLVKADSLLPENKNEKRGLFSFVSGLMGSGKDKRESGKSAIEPITSKSGKGVREQESGTKEMARDARPHAHENNLFDKDGNIIIDDDINNIPAILRRKKHITEN